MRDIRPASCCFSMCTFFLSGMEGSVDIEGNKFRPNGQERKSSLNIKFLGGMSRGRPDGYPGGRHGPYPSERRKIKFFERTSLARTSMTRGDLRKTSCKKTSGWFSSPKWSVNFKRDVGNSQFQGKCRKAHHVHILDSRCGWVNERGCACSCCRNAVFVEATDGACHFRQTLRRIAFLELLGEIQMSTHETMS